MSDRMSDNEYESGRSMGYAIALRDATEIIEDAWDQHSNNGPKDTTRCIICKTYANLLLKIDDLGYV